MRRSGRSVNRKDRDRGVEMRLTERTGKLIPEARRGVPKGAILTLTLTSPMLHFTNAFVIKQALLGSNVPNASDAVFHRTVPSQHRTLQNITQHDNQPYSQYKHSLTFRVRRYTHLQCIRL